MCLPYVSCIRMRKFSAQTHILGDNENHFLENKILRDVDGNGEGIKIDKKHDFAISFSCFLVNVGGRTRYLLSHFINILKLVLKIVIVKSINKFLLMFKNNFFFLKFKSIDGKR